MITFTKRTLGLLEKEATLSCSAFQSDAITLFSFEHASSVNRDGMAPVQQSQPLLGERLNTRYCNANAAKQDPEVPR